MLHTYTHVSIAYVYPCQYNFTLIARN